MFLNGTFGGINMNESFNEVAELPPPDKRPNCFCDDEEYKETDEVCNKCGFNRFCSGELTQDSHSGLIKRNRFFGQPKRDEKDE